MRETNNSFFIGDSPRGSVAALPDKAGGLRAVEGILQRIAAANESLEQATARLIRLAELAYGARRFEDLKAITEALQAVPFAAARRAGTYYQGVLVMRAGELARAAEMLETLDAPRALLTRGTIAEYQGDFESATRLHVEAMKAGRERDPFTFAGAGLQLATIRGIEGDHAASLHAFESIGSLVRQVARLHPSLYAIWYNSLAVELAELGRIEEARQAAAVALASPVAAAYPEFKETAREIAQAQPAAIAVAVVLPQEEAETTEAGPSLSTVDSEPPARYLFTFQPYARTLLNPRASPRAPPALF